MLTVFFFLHRIRFLLSGVLVVTAALLFVCAAAPHSIAAPAKNTHSTDSALAMGISDSPNAVTGAAAIAAYRLNQSLSAAARTTGSGLRAAASAVAWTGSTIGRGVQHGALATARAIGGSVLFVGHIPGSIFGFFTHTSVVNAIIRPAEHSDVPVIDPNSPAISAAQAALPATQADEAAPILAVWPIHGLVTTQFGEPEWPYQAVHTGLDISDGKTPGSTPIVAFRSGKVIDVEHSGGLGNHVVIDHGSGVTSVYGHLNSIAVQVGQNVDITTIIGYEGTTGVSTGPHLHFEIRIDGQATDPHQFINGQP